MKKIKVSDKMYEFLMDLSKELNTQDDRATSILHFFQIQTENKIVAKEYCGEVEWYNGKDGSWLGDDEDIKDFIFEHKEWEEGNEEHEELFLNMEKDEIEGILRNCDYEQEWYTFQNTYKNSFLTEKACKEHIRLNKHHYCNPVDFLTYAFRNPELEKVMEFLRSLKSESSKEG